MEVMPYALPEKQMIIRLLLLEGHNYMHFMCVCVCVMGDLITKFYLYAYFCFGQSSHISHSHVGSWYRASRINKELQKHSSWKSGKILEQVFLEGQVLNYHNNYCKILNLLLTSCAIKFLWVNKGPIINIFLVVL